MMHQQIDTTGVMNARRHHEHGSNGNQATVTEPCKGLIRGNYSAGAEHHKHPHHNQVGRESPRTHQYQRGTREAQREPTLPVHQHFFPIRKLAG
jgi:hypothetical protein